MAIPVTISNCGAVTGAVFSNNSVYAVNGVDCTVKNVCDDCCFSTFRPYSFLSKNCGCTLAISGFCSNRVYILDCCFKEIGSICFSFDYGPLLAAYLTEGNKLILTYRKTVIIANTNGSYMDTIATSSCDDSDFIAAILTDGGLLTAFNDGNRDTIQIRYGDGTTQSCTLPRCVGIKSFVVNDDCSIYGLFSKGYPYRYLLPIVTDGMFNCVSEECFGTNICSIF